MYRYIFTTDLYLHFLYDTQIKTLLNRCIHFFYKQLAEPTDAFS